MEASCVGYPLGMNEVWKLVHRCVAAAPPAFVHLPRRALHDASPLARLHRRALHRASCILHALLPVDHAPRVAELVEEEAALLADGRAPVFMCPAQFAPPPPPPSPPSAREGAASMCTAHGACEHVPSITSCDAGAVATGVTTFRFYVTQLVKLHRAAPALFLHARIAHSLLPLIHAVASSVRAGTCVVPPAVLAALRDSAAPLLLEMVVTPLTAPPACVALCAPTLAHGDWHALPLLLDLLCAGGGDACVTRLQLVLHVLRTHAADAVAQPHAWTTPSRAYTLLASCRLLARALPQLIPHAVCDAVWADVARALCGTRSDAPPAPGARHVRPH
ncbi:hypothetical protein EON68_04165, partial [archaeon]